MTTRRTGTGCALCSNTATTQKSKTQTTFGQTPRLRLRYLSKTAILQKGMKVYTDGRGKLFPPNIPIGTIEDFEVGPVYGEAEIKPAVDFTNLKNVFVITDSPGD